MCLHLLVGKLFMVQYTDDSKCFVRDCFKSLNLWLLGSSLVVTLWPVGLPTSSSHQYKQYGILCKKSAGTNVPAFLISAVVLLSVWSWTRCQDLTSLCLASESTKWRWSGKYPQAITELINTCSTLGLMPNTQHTLSKNYLMLLSSHKNHYHHCERFLL